MQIDINLATKTQWLIWIRTILMSKQADTGAIVAALKVAGFDAKLIKA